MEFNFFMANLERRMNPATSYPGQLTGTNTPFNLNYNTISSNLSTEMGFVIVYGL
jgi:hypothetical protein